MTDAFEEEYLGKFDPQELLRVEVLARTYHETCELYDRTVCTGPPGVDGVLPGNAMEAGAINKHAKKVLAQLLQENPDIGRTKLMAAIGRHARAGCR